MSLHTYKILHHKPQTAELKLTLKFEANERPIVQDSPRRLAYLVSLDI